MNKWVTKFGTELWESLAVATRRDTIQQVKMAIIMISRIREVSKKKYSLLVGPGYWGLGPPPPLSRPVGFSMTFFVLLNTILGPFLPLFRP